MIISGHTWPDIQSYTLNQIGVFVREAAKAREEERKNLIYSTWVGVNADSKGIQSILKSSAKSKAVSGTKTNKQEWLRLARAMQGMK